MVFRKGDQKKRKEEKMNTSAKIGGLLAAVMLAASGSAMAAEPVNPYVTSSDGKVVMDPFGLCWRTGFWTPAQIGRAHV